MVNVKELQSELERLLNIHNVDSYCNTPDHVLAEAVINFISTLARAQNRNLAWHGLKYNNGVVCNFTCVKDDCTCEARFDEESVINYDGEVIRRDKL